MPSKPLLLKLHRWVALVFALPLLAVILSGLVLSVEPALKATTPAGTVTLPRLEAVLEAAGPAGRSGSLMVQGYAGAATVGARPGAGATSYDLASAVPVQRPALAALFGTMRQLHEKLLLDLGWLVTASTVALIALAPLGLLLGWPKLRNTVAGWHRVTSWVLLPLLVGSPLTGLALAFHLGQGVPAAAPAAPLPPLVETVREVAARHDLDGLDMIRTMQGARLVRVLDATGTAVTYRATAEGLQPMPANWWRVLHEGNWGGVAGSVVNLVISVALLGLLGTGGWIWGRRKLMQRRAARQRAAAGLSPRLRRRQAA